ncbi:MAG: cytochrome c biogenesis protein ResB [Anaerolineae bacterium]
MNAGRAWPPQKARKGFGAVARGAWGILSARSLSLWLLLALAFLSALGTWFPQRPPSAALPSEGFAEWEAALQARYGAGLASFLERLGLLDLYSTPLFLAVVAALVVNGLACTLARWRTQWRILGTQPRPSPPPEPFPPGMWAVRVAFSGGANAGEAAAREACRRVGLRPRVERVGAAGAFVAERGRWTALGTLLAHLGLAVVAAGLALGAAQGARVRTPPLAPGQGYPLPWDQNVNLHVQDFRIERYPTGSPRAYLLRVAVTREGEAVGTVQELRLGVPASLPGGGLAFLYGYGPAVRLDVRRADGKGRHSPAPVLSHAYLPLVSPHSLTLPDGTSLVVERAVGIPGQYHLQRWRGDVLVAEGTGPAGAALALGDLEVQVAPDWYVVLELTRDPGFPWVVAGVLAALAGAGVALGGRWRQVRGFWQEGELVLWTRGAGGGSLGPRAWQRLVREVVLASGGQPRTEEGLGR